MQILKRFDTELVQKGVQGQGEEMIVGLYAV